MTSIIVFGAIVLGVVGCIAAAYFYGRSVGKAVAENKILDETADAQRAQLEAANKAPQGREAVLERLRKGSGL